VDDVQDVFVVLPTVGKDLLDQPIVRSPSAILRSMTTLVAESSGPGGLSSLSRATSRTGSVVVGGYEEAGRWSAQTATAVWPGRQLQVATPAALTA